MVEYKDLFLRYQNQKFKTKKATLIQPIIKISISDCTTFQPH